MMLGRNADAAAWGDARMASCCCPWCRALLVLLLCLVLCARGCRCGRGQAVSLSPPASCSCSSCLLLPRPLLLLPASGP